MESSTFFHEMFYALQSYTEQEIWNGSNLNMEVEAHFAQQIYIEQMSENGWKLWKGRTKFDSRWKAVQS